jgi:DNA-binding NtrC family response regulator
MLQYCLKDSSAFSMNLIVIVEDEPAIQQMLMDLAEWWGCRTEVFATADEAARYLRSGVEQPSLVITDHAMPGILSGFDLVVEAHERWPSLPIIMISAYAYEVTLPEVKHIVLLDKPWTIASLSELAESLMRNGEAERQRMDQGSGA